MNKRDLTIGTVLALALGACGGQSAADADLAEVEASMGQEQSTEATAPTAPTAPQPVQALEPVVLSEDAVAVGSAIAPSGAVAVPKAAFAVGDTVYVSVATAGRPQGAEVAVYWVGPDGSSVKEERKPIGAGAQNVNFKFGRADGMKTGDFIVQVDVAGQPVGMADFSVR